MPERLHEIAVHEPWEYDGQSPIVARGAGIVHSDDGDYYLLDVVTPFTFQDEQVSQVIVTPRYQGVTLSETFSTSCIVGVARVKPGTVLRRDERIEHSCMHYFAIGKIGVRNQEPE
jgi:hypothetical protein